MLRLGLRRKSLLDHVIGDDGEGGAQGAEELGGHLLGDGGKLIVGEVSRKRLDRLDEVKGLNAAI